MEIKIIVDSGATDIPSNGFDTQDYAHDPLSVMEIKQELSDYIQSSGSEGSDPPVIILNRPMGSLSIPDLYQLSISEAIQQSVRSIKFVVGSREIKHYLEDQLPPRIPLRQVFAHQTHQLILSTGDITEVEADAIVNASNIHLKLGAGVSEAIAAKAGTGLQGEMSAIARMRSIGNGDAVITGAHLMTACRYIIHAATADGSAKTVSRAVSQCLDLCADRKIGSIAFPALGTGTGGLDEKDCADAMAKAVLQWFAAQHQLAAFPRRIIFVLWNKGIFDIFSSVMESIYSVPGENSR